LLDVSLTVSPIKDAEGRIVGASTIARDITDRKRYREALEKRVQERTAELTAANQELEAFTYSVAHDLRAPLRHIDAFSKIIVDEFSDNLTPEVRHYLENIRKGSRNMSRLVDDLLNLARVGRQELKREWVPLSPLVDEVIAELKSETAHRKVEWSIAPLPAVESDPVLMKQVFANLLSNAIKYTRPRQQARIEIGQRWIDHQNVIYVRDNGVGFSMKYADKLFGVFQRLHRADEFEGTGVGLATVDRVVRKHGGRIWAESEVDKGATFYFTLDGLNRNAGEHNSNDQERN
jgi:light-regulated signal transduction histidine kinase (bacteriophytochrome)